MNYPMVRRRRRGSAQSTQLRMGVAEVHPANTPPRLFQLFSTGAGGAVVWEETAAEALQVDKGWTVSPVVLDPAEATYLTRYAGKPVRSGQMAFFARCDAVLTSTAEGTVVCGRPDGMSAERVDPAELNDQQFSPIGQFVSRNRLRSVVVLYDEGLPGVGDTSRSVLDRAQKAMRVYRRLEDFYRIYAECASAFGRQFSPEQEEANQALVIRDTLARFAQPVYVLRDHFQSGSTQVAPAQLTLKGAVSFLGAVFVVSAVNVALWLMSHFLPDLERVDRWVDSLRDLLCARVRALYGVNKRERRLTRDQAQVAACIAKLGCDDPDPLPWGKISLAGLAAVGGAYYYRRRLK